MVQARVTLCDRKEANPIGLVFLGCSGRLLADLSTLGGIPPNVGADKGTA